MNFDDLFQILNVRDVLPFEAKRRRITELLQLGKLRVDFHIAGGTRKMQPMRQATPEELAAFERGETDLDFLYERAPPGGLTGAVDPQSWEFVFALAIRDARLMVEPRCALDFPWSAYTFSISNPVVIDHLFPPPRPTPVALPSEQDADADQPVEDPRDVAMKKRHEAGSTPGRGGSIGWDAYCKMIRTDCGASEGDEGFSKKTLERRLKKLRLAK